MLIDTSRALIIKHTPVKVVGWLGVAFSTFCTAGALSAGARGSALVFIAFAALGVFTILTSGSMQVDSHSIRYYLPLRSYQIKWNEIRSMEIDRQGYNMVFVGDNKRLAIIGPGYWSRRNKLETLNLIGTQIDKYGIQILPTQKALFRLSRNTRIER